jgi:hypothetical protein
MQSAYKNTITKQLHNGYELYMLWHTKYAPKHKTNQAQLKQLYTITDSISLEIWEVIDDDNDDDDYYYYLFI